MQTLLWNKVDQLKTPISAYIPVEHSIEFINYIKEYVRDFLSKDDQNNNIDK